MTIQDVVNNFNTTPFLFVGSGMTRRYLDLPDWRSLLEYFAKEIMNDSFAYSAYESKTKFMECKTGLMPKVAELIQQDYDAKWFGDSNIRTVDDIALEQIKSGVSPFKAEIAAYIKRNTQIVEDYRDEVEKLTEISEKSIAGVITTNYDTFLEDHLRGFKKYVGQNELIFSSIQGIAEIYKIHGSVEMPDSIVINEADYLRFEEKSAYLAAKLMTIFMEYPIIFIGYSIRDNNIQNIIKSIVNCLDEQQVKQLENRFVFIEYNKSAVEVAVTPYTIMIEGKPLTMRKIELSDFMPLYDALEIKRAKLPVRMLRHFKQELYSYVITNTPTATLRVAALDDTRVADDELVLAIGKASELGLKGLSGIDSNEWYRNILLDDLGFTADELLEYAFPKLIKQNSGRLPVNKYLTEATKEFSACIELAEKQTFDVIISKSIKDHRQCLGSYHSVWQIWEGEKDNMERATRLISHLPEENMDIEELERMLHELFRGDPDILKHVTTWTRSNLRRLILIYDYLKWGKK